MRRKQPLENPLDFSPLKSHRTNRFNRECGVSQALGEGNTVCLCNSNLVSVIPV